MTNKYLEKIASKSGIEIKPSHEGLLHKRLGVPAGEKIPDSDLASAKIKAKESGDLSLMKQVTFAQNAKKWKH